VLHNLAYIQWIAVYYIPEIHYITVFLINWTLIMLVVTQADTEIHYITAILINWKLLILDVTQPDTGYGPNPTHQKARPTVQWPTGFWFDPIRSSENHNLLDPTRLVGDPTHGQLCCGSLDILPHFVSKQHLKYK